MSEFSATDAAFEGFRVARERPAAMALWAFAWMAMSLITGILVVKLAGHPFTELLAYLKSVQTTGGQPDPEHLAALYAPLLPFVAVMTPVTLVFYSVMMTAAYRLVMDSHNSRLGLKLGPDELRQIALMVILSVGLFAVYILSIIVSGLIVGLAMAVNPILGGLFVVAAIVGVFGLMIYLCVRISLAGPQTFDFKRISLFGSLALTRGRVRLILGTYLLALVFAILVSLLGFLIVSGLFAIIGGGFAKLLEPDVTSLRSYFSPLRIAYLACSSVLSALTWAIMVCPVAVIYQHLKTPKPVA
jgi:hypothetical protein